MARDKRVKVKTEKTWFERANGKTDFIKVFTVDPDSGTFHIKLPAEVVAGLAIDDRNGEVHGKTIDEVDAKFKAVLKTFKESREKTTRVILYDFSSINGGHSKGSQFSFSSGLGLVLHADIFDEIETSTMDGKKRYSYKEVERYDFENSVWLSAFPRELKGDRSSGGRLYGSRGEQAADRLEWTEEREAFFIKMVAALQGLILSFEMITKDAGIFGKFILTGQLPGLLPAPPVAIDNDSETH